MHPQQNDNDFFRMEKSVITKENTDQMFKISGDHIAEAILYHICYEHQYNLFGFGMLDPEAFGAKFGFSMKYLREIHDSPYQNTILKAACKKTDRRYRNRETAPEKETYCTRLQNALYILMNLPLVVNRTILDNDKKLIRKIEPVRILNSLYIIQDKKTGKVSYVYELDDGFLRNLSNLYQTASARSLAQLRRSGNNLLYLHLLRLRDALFAQGKTSTDPEGTPTFAYLCDLASINTNQEPKYQKRDLNAAFKLICKETELQFDVEWAKDQNGLKYCPIFHFIPCLGEILGPDSWVNGMRRKEERVDVAAVDFKHKLYASCPYRSFEHIEDAEALFFEWIKTDTPKRRQALEFDIANTFHDIGHTIPQDIPQRVAQFIRSAQELPPEKFDDYVKAIFSSPKFKF